MIKIEKSMNVIFNKLLEYLTVFRILAYNFKFYEIYFKIYFFWHKIAK